MFPNLYPSSITARLLCGASVDPGVKCVGGGGGSGGRRGGVVIDYIRG